MTRLNLEIKIRIIILMVKFQSAKTLKPKKIKDIPRSKIIRKIYEKSCQTGSVEELHRIGRPKN